MYSIQCVLPTVDCLGLTLLVPWVLPLHRTISHHAPTLSITLFCLFVIMNPSVLFSFLQLIYLCRVHLLDVHLCVLGSLRAKSWLNSIFLLGGQSQSAQNQGASVSVGCRRTIDTAMLQWDYITDMGKKICFSTLCLLDAHIYLAQEADCFECRVCSYLVSTKEMTSVLNVQSGKLILLPSLPLSVEI